MNLYHDLLLLMFTLSQMRDRVKIIHFFQESVCEVFKPQVFSYSEQKAEGITYAEEIATSNSKYGYMVSYTEPSDETKRLLQNAVQMLAVILDKLRFEHELGEKADSLGTLAQQRLSEINIYVKELEKSKLDSLNLIDDLKNEIAEREKAERELHESEERFRKVFEEGPLGMAMAGFTDGHFIVVNRALCEMLGYNEEELKRLTFRDVTHPDHRTEDEEAVRELLEGKTQKHNTEKRYVKKNGDVIWAARALTRITSADGKSFYTLAMIEDITERKQAEEALRESRAILQAAMDNSPAGIAIADAPDGKLRYVNNAGLLIRGGDRQSIVDGIGIEQYVASWQILDLDGRPLDPDEVPLARAVLFGETNSREFIVRRTSNDDRIVLGNAAPIMDERGKVTAGIVIFTDITERKQAEAALQKSQTQLQAIMDYSPALISIKDLNGNIILANQGLAVLDAPPLNEMIGKNVFDIFPKEVAEQLWNNDLAALQAKAPVRSEEVVKHKDGVWHTYLTVKFPIYLTSDQPFGICAISNDITERKQAEEALSDSEQRLQFVLYGSQLGYWDWDLTTNEVKRNERWAEMLGYRLDDIEFTVKQWIDFVHPDDQVMASQSIQDNIEGRKSLHKLEYRMRTKEGQYKWILDQAQVVKRDSNQHALRMSGTHTDITESKQAADALRESEDKFKYEFEYSVIGKSITQFNGGMQVNKALCDMLGYSPQEMQDEKWQELTHPDDIELTQKEINTLLSGEKESVRFEKRFIHKNGLSVWVDLSSTIRRDAQGKPLYLMSALIDITERKRAEDARQQSETLFRMLFELSPDAVLLLDPHDPNVSSLIVDCNAAACLMSGYARDELIGQPIDIVNADPYTQAGQTAYLKKLRDAGNLKYEVFHRRKNGVVFPVEVSTTIIKVGERELVIGIDRDITERKQAEKILQEYNIRLETEVEERTRELRETQEQLVRQERLAALGQLAGSIGHELRNPLGVISNAAYFLKITQPNASEKVREYLDIIEKETRTSDKIIADLLEFTRIKSLDRQPASVSELIHRSLERNPAPESVETKLEIPADLPQIYVDPQHVIQVLGNLISNAFQSMIVGGTNGRKLTVSAAVQSSMIKVDIQDMGVGILPENMKKLFEPLFTTKIKGIGLGLAVSRKLTEANGGRIEVESESGKGSTFTVYLPIYKESK